MTLSSHVVHSLYSFFSSPSSSSDCSLSESSVAATRDVSFSEVDFLQNNSVDQQQSMGPTMTQKNRRLSMKNSVYNNKDDLRSQVVVQSFKAPPTKNQTTILHQESNNQQNKKKKLNNYKPSFVRKKQATVNILWLTAEIWLIIFAFLDQNEIETIQYRVSSQLADLLYRDLSVRNNINRQRVVFLGDDSSLIPASSYSPVDTNTTDITTAKMTVNCAIDDISYCSSQHHGYQPYDHRLAIQPVDNIAVATEPLAQHSKEYMLWQSEKSVKNTNGVVTIEEQVQTEEDEMSSSSVASFSGNNGFCSNVLSDDNDSDVSCSSQIDSELSHGASKTNDHQSSWRKVEQTLSHRKKLQDGFERKDLEHQIWNTYSIMIVGDKNVGKTSLCKRFIARSLLEDSLEPSSSVVDSSLTHNNTDFELEKVHSTYIAQSYKLMKKKFMDPFKVIIEDVELSTLTKQTMNHQVNYGSYGSHQNGTSLLDDPLFGSPTSDYFRSQMSNTNTTHSNSHLQSDFDAVMLVFSLQDRASFDSLYPLFKRMLAGRKGKMFPVVLVANKADVAGERSVSTADVDKMMMKLDKRTSYTLYNECSTKNQRDVDVLFSSTLHLMQRFRTSDQNTNETNENKSSCVIC